VATRSSSSGQTAFLDLDLTVVSGNRAGSVSVMESARQDTRASLLGSLLHAGDRVLCSRHGEDSARLVEMAERAGLDVVSCDVPVGEGAPLSLFSHLLGWDASIKAVIVAQEESSLGVRNDIGQIRRVLDETGSTARLLVDTTPPGAVGFRQDEWAVDAVVCGASPAEAGTVTVLSTSRATSTELATTETATVVGHVGALDAAEVWLSALPRDLARLHDTWLAEGVRRGLEGLGLTLCAEGPQWPSDFITVCSLPEGIDRDQIAPMAFEALGGGAWDDDFTGLAPDQVRLDHRRLRTEKACIAAVAAMEIALPRRAVRAHPGDGIRATFSWFAEAAPLALA
jgi:alanine-glyoxylate transaminase / serine-glyoxylate transaminase / serine-pyruvate transaminase